MIYFTRIFSRVFNTLNNFKNIVFTEKKMPIGRWIREDNYTGTMSNVSYKLTNYNNHDHCGGELCKYPPISK